jgi:pseudaminic acid biosynthesis-associated methylase
MGSRHEEKRLERLWAGDFGIRYVERNAVLDPRRAGFWHPLVARLEIRSVLEVGCGQGANLAPLVECVNPADVWGIDVNDVAIARARESAPGANIVHARAAFLPFRDRFFDLTFTVGVLIHQPEESLRAVIGEIVRCSRRYVLWAEYHASRTEEVPYHGEVRALFRRDYGAIFRAFHPTLTVVDEGFLDTAAGFDRVSWQLLTRT